MRLFYVFLFCVLGCIVITHPAWAAERNSLDGVWGFDTEATVALMRQAGDLPAPVAEIQKRLARTRVVIDLMNKTFRVTENGEDAVNSPIALVSEREGVITLHRKTKGSGERREVEERYRFSEDGRLTGIENGRAAYVLRRLE